MKYSRIICSLAMMAAACFAKAERAHVVPQPMEYIEGTGSFALPQTLAVAGDSIDAAVRFLSRHGISAEPAQRWPDMSVRFGGDGPSGSYQLLIAPNCICVTAADRAGLMYAMETLSQIIEQSDGQLPALTINDQPRMEYRGMMIDVVRCYQPLDDLKKLIDAAAQLKLNKLHLHLTDDNGWRTEIKKYPKLTEVGAWRVDRSDPFAGRANQKEGEPATYGGYYTQDELRDLVAYAAEREIEVIPEIEMPAHAVAAIASYPELACDLDGEFVGVLPGLGGKAAQIIMCAGRDSTLQFVTDVLDETMAIFPSEYIHLGGDEANKTRWEKCPRCNERIAHEHLDGYEELQAWFMDSINSYVRRHGRTAIGWDEVTYGKPKEDMVIMGWQGDGSVAVNYARETGRRFIMTPAKSTYLIRYQGPQWFEPFTYFGNITLKDAYEFEPVQADWTPAMKDQLWGVQGSMWTEFCRKPSDVQRQIFPRMLAIADVAWRPEGSRDWDGFVAAADNLLSRFDGQGVAWAKSMYNIQHKAAPNGDGTVTVEAENIRPDATIAVAGADQSVYAGPIIVSQPGMIGFQANFPDGTIGEALNLNFDFNKATGRQAVSPNCNNGQIHALTNGLRGSYRGSDFEWAGWHNRDVEFTVDLGSAVPVHKVALGVLANANMLSGLPDEFKIYAAGEDGNYKLVKTIATDPAKKFPLSPAVFDIVADGLNLNARYIKVEAPNPGAIPDGFPREGSATWTYIDEIIVE